MGATTGDLGPNISKMTTNRDLMAAVRVEMMEIVVVDKKAVVMRRLPGKCVLFVKN